MLQQTQVATVLPYYLRWMERFPTVEGLASAEEQEVLALWQGLGYYRRCRMLLEGARFVALNGLPRSAKEWLRVPGVGPYTANAIASIALGEAVPVVDGNVDRVFARLTACSLEKPARTRLAWKWASELLPSGRPGDWNQALMELGATVCRPTKPNCCLCPVRTECVAHASGRVNELPFRTARQASVRLEMVAWIPRCDGRLGVRQIQNGEWWVGMWEFPRGSQPCAGSFRPCGTVKHTVTHHRIIMQVWELECEFQEASLRWVSRADLEKLPMPSIQRKALSLLDS
jgi:A/G-specific adenine glycosylase